MWDAAILHQDWTSLKRLDLSICKISDDSIDNLLKVEWPNLKKLWLNNSELTDVGVNKMMQKQWKQLVYLALCIHDKLIKHKIR